MFKKKIVFKKNVLKKKCFQKNVFIQGGSAICHQVELPDGVVWFRHPMQFFRRLLKEHWSIAAAPPISSMTWWRIHTNGNGRPVSAPSKHANSTDDCMKTTSVNVFQVNIKIEAYFSYNSMLCQSCHKMLS